MFETAVKLQTWTSNEFNSHFLFKKKDIEKDHCFDKLRLLKNIKLYFSNSYISNKNYENIFLWFWDGF